MTQEYEVMQQHIGSGDNVGRDKIVVLAVSPESFQSVALNIMTGLSERGVKSAKEKIRALEMTAKKDADADNLVHLLLIHMRLTEGEASPDDYSAAISIHGHIKKTGMIRDLSIAAILRIDARLGRIEDARARFNLMDDRDELFFSKEVYYECLASVDEIKSDYIRGKYDFDVNRLYGMVRGALRVHDYELSLSISDWLRTTHNSFNGKVLYLHTMASVINKEINGKHYWLISRTLRAKIIDMIEDIIECIEQCAGEDVRLLSIAALSNDFILCDHKELNDLCVKHHEKLNLLSNTLQTPPQNANVIENLSAVLLKSQVSVEEAFALTKGANTERLREWIINGGKVAGDNLNADAANMHILSKSLTNDKDYPIVKMLEIKVGAFLEKNSSRLSELNPLFVLEVTRTMSSLGLSHLAIDIIRPLIVKDVWLSPIVQHYLYSLLVKDQLKTLSEFLHNINKEEWEVNTWHIKAMMEQRQHFFDAAIESWKEALKLNANSLWAWISLINVSEHQNKENIKKLLNEIPEEAFEKPSDYAVPVLLKMACYDGFDRAEKIISKWFISDPLGSYIDVANFNLNQVIMGVEPHQYSENVAGCYGGVVYQKDETIVSKLLIDFENPVHDCLLSIHKPLGKLLYSMSVGDVKQLNMHEIKLIERTPPFLAITRKSFELRNDNNDGSDCFFTFSVPENPDDFLGFLQKKLNYGTDNTHNILENREISIMCKGYILRPNDPVKAVFDVLGSKSGFNHQLPSRGEKRPNRVILDIYSIIYIAMSGFARILNNDDIDFIVTIETEQLLRQCIDEVSDANFLSVGLTESGELWRQTSEDIMNSSRGIIDGIVGILEKSKVVSPMTADMPPTLLNISKIVDKSVYSSMRLSVSNDLAWLCIDDTISGLFNVCGHKSINAVDFFLSSTALLTEKERANVIYLFAVTAFPYPLAFNDLTFLSGIRERDARYYLSKILEKCKNFIDGNLNELTSFLSDLLYRSLLSALLNSELSANLDNSNPLLNRDISKLFNVCFELAMRADSTIKAESKIALLLLKLLVKINNQIALKRYLCEVAVRFLDGHFVSIDTVIREMEVWEAKILDRISERTVR